MDKEIETMVPFLAREKYQHGIASSWQYAFYIALTLHLMGVYLDHNLCSCTLLFQSKGRQQPM